MRYKITADGPIVVKTGDPLHGRIEVSLSAGRTSPKSEVEEAAFELLVEMNLAEREPETKAEARHEKASGASLRAAPREQVGPSAEGGEE